MREPLTRHAALSGCQPSSIRQWSSEPITERRRPRLPRLLAVAVALVLAAACAVGTSDESGGPGPTGPSGPPGASGSDQRRAEQPSAEEFEDDLQGAVGTAEEYWRERFRAAGQRFVPVRRIFPYQRDGEVTCGGEPVPRNNAVYCSAGDFIAYDVNFAARAFSRVGDAFLYYLLGHEYAHAIQVRLGLSYNFTIEQELQADCMAGAYIGDSVRAKRLTLESGDIEEFRAGLLAVGDDPSIPWFAPGAHGTAAQRTAAFFTGYERSVAPCGRPVG